MMVRLPLGFNVSELKNSRWFSGRPLGIAGSCMPDEVIAAMPEPIRAQLIAGKNKSRLAMARCGVDPNLRWTDYFDGADNVARRSAAPSVVDRPAPAIPQRRRQVNGCRWYKDFQISGIAHQYGQQIYNGDIWRSMEEGCFEIADDIQLQLGHDDDGPVFAFARHLSFDNSPDAMGFPRLSFFAKRIVLSEETQEFLNAYMKDGQLRGVGLSIGATILKSHFEAHYDRQVQVVEKARLDHIAIVSPSKSEPACKGTYMHCYGRIY